MMETASSSNTNPMLAPVSSTTITTTRISASAVVRTHARVRRAREEETETATATESAASTVIVHVEAPPGLLGFSLAPTSTTPPGMLIKQIQDTCVIKDRIRIGDQLLGIDEESIPTTTTTRSTLLQEVVQLIHRKRSNPIRIFTFKRTTSSSSSSNNKRKYATNSTTVLTRLEGQPQPQLQQQHDMERQHHTTTLFRKEKPVVKGTTGHRGKENRKDGGDESSSDNYHCNGPPPAVAPPAPAPAAAVTANVPDTSVGVTPASLSSSTSYQWNGPEHAAFMHGIHCCRSESWYTSMIRQYDNIWSILSLKFVPTKTALEIQWYAYMSFIGKFYGWNIHHDHYWTLQQYTVLIATLRHRLHWHTLITYQDKIRQQTFQSNLVRDQQQQQHQSGASTTTGKETVTIAAMKNYRASPSAILIDATVVPNADTTAITGRLDRTRPPTTPSKTTRNLDATVLPNVDTAIASLDRTRPPITSTATRNCGAKKKHATTTVARCGANANQAAVVAKVKAWKAERDLAALSQAVANAEAAAEVIANEAAAVANNKKRKDKKEPIAEKKKVKHGENQAKWEAQKQEAMAAANKKRIAKAKWEAQKQEAMAAANKKRIAKAEGKWVCHPKWEAQKQEAMAAANKKRIARPRPPPTPPKTTRNLDATVLPNVDTAIASHDRTRPPTTSATAKVTACQAERDLAALSQAVANAEAAAEVIANEAAAKAREEKKARRI